MIAINSSPELIHRLSFVQKNFSTYLTILGGSRFLTSVELIVHRLGSQGISRHNLLCAKGVNVGSKVAALLGTWCDSKKKKKQKKPDSKSTVDDRLSFMTNICRVTLDPRLPLFFRVCRGAWGRGSVVGVPSCNYRHDARTALRRASLQSLLPSHITCLYTSSVSRLPLKIAASCYCKATMSKRSSIDIKERE